jgi:general secretion pathway protein B
MSYILDALRRADAERERGVVPSLQSQQHTVIEEDDALPRPRRLMWVIVGLGGALLALLAWTLFSGATTAPRPVAEGSVVPAAVAPAPTTPKVVLPVTAEAAPAPAPAATPVVAPAAVPPVPTRVAPAPAAAARPPAVATAEPGRAARRAGVDPASAAPAASASRIYAQAELPEDVRRDLPRIAINGSSYSGDAASRMVMISGQIFHEGDSLGAGLVLEKINRRSVVLAFRGWRYEVAF